MRSVRSLVIALVLVLTSVASFADVPPPEGYVETCTVSKQETKTTECVSCRANFRNHEDCDNYPDQGYSKECKTRGASTWTEVWCRDKSYEPKEKSIVSLGEGAHLTLLFEELGAALEVAGTDCDIAAGVIAEWVAKYAADVDRLGLRLEDPEWLSAQERTDLQSAFASVESALSSVTATCAADEGLRDALASLAAALASGGKP